MLLGKLMRGMLIVSITLGTLFRVAARPHSQAFDPNYQSACSLFHGIGVDGLRCLLQHTLCGTTCSMR